MSPQKDLYNIFKIDLYYQFGYHIFIIRKGLILKNKQLLQER